jgi:hypothetical protein
MPAHHRQTKCGADRYSPRTLTPRPLAESHATARGRGWNPSTPCLRCRRSAHAMIRLTRPLKPSKLMSPASPAPPGGSSSPAWAVGSARSKPGNVPAAGPGGPAATARGPQVRHAVRTEASVRLRGGDLAAVAVYDRYGQIRVPTRTAPTSVVSMWLADDLGGRPSRSSLSSGRCGQFRHVRPSRPSERRARSPWLGELTFGRPARSEPSQRRDRDEVQDGRRGVDGQAGPRQSPRPG